MSDTFSKVEVITGVARRRRFSTELKLAVVAETMQPGMSISYVARRHGLSPSLVFRWRRLMSEGGKEAVRADDEVVAASEVRRLQERVRELCQRRSKFPQIGRSNFPRVRSAGDQASADWAGWCFGGRPRRRGGGVKPARVLMVTSRPILRAALTRRASRKVSSSPSRASTASNAPISPRSSWRIV